MNNIKLLYIDLFCGAGGTTTGVEQAELNGQACAKVIACVNHDVNAIASHHGDTEPTHPISVIVATADALSASRPGARRESLENYIKRLQKLEEIANEHKGVEKTFAIQAGREIRVIVNPEEVDDTKTYKIAKEVKNKIEETMQYPGNIKVNVIREVRAVKLAR